MDRVAFTLFGIDIMWYGILMATGMVLGVFIALREAKRLGIKEDDILNLAIIAIPCGLIGARLYYVIFNWSYYSGNISEILNFRGGGMAIHGGLLGGVLAGYIYTKVKKLNFFKMADCVVLGIPLAQAIGRWGNYLNKEAHGGPTDLPWGIMVDGIKVHPTFLYESIWDLGVFIFLMLFRKKQKYEGQILVYYITLYQYYVFYKLNPQPLKIKRFVNIFIIVIIMSSSVPILHARLLDVLKVFLILSSLCFMNNSFRMQRLLRIVVVFTIINILFSFWQIRFFLKFSRIDVLFTSSSVQLIDFHYTDKWVSKNIDEEGHLIEWLKLGYRPL